MKKVGIDFIPSNDFSLYDHVLDTAVMVDAIPARYRSIAHDVDRYFAMARGHQAGEIDLTALEMTKWFDTNYHYIVPEIAKDQRFTLNPKKILNEVSEARSLGIETRPVILGPFSFLKLAKDPWGGSTLSHLESLTKCYRELLEILAAMEIEWVQVDEPCLVQTLSDPERKAFSTSYQQLTTTTRRPKLMLTTYFGGLGDNREIALNAGCEGVHLDLVRCPDQLHSVVESIKIDSCLSLGLIDGRNIWKADLAGAQELVSHAIDKLGSRQVIIASSCSLLHSPLNLDAEDDLESDIKSWMAFARQKLDEIIYLAGNHGEQIDRHTEILKSRKTSKKTYNSSIRAELKQITPKMTSRPPFALRSQQQKQLHKTPAFPTTTIGSFPQSNEIRQMRRKWRREEITNHEYNAYLQEQTENCIRKQEKIGLDVLVHGEFERSDMVEYFGEKLEGFTFTKHGWVQSYGSRYVKPPIIFGDVSRPKPMTVKWSKYAQSLTTKPVKGMLTGPVTILQWSFVRDDQPRSETCKQIALALRREIADLEAAGINVIQVDEPAIREGLPLNKRDWGRYLEAAVQCFKIATAGAQDSTQIHTHMCYSEFSDILAAIADLDADVLSIETSRSKMELLGDFATFRYPNEIGPGVYDIHSPRIPTEKEMTDLLLKAAQVLPSSRLWVNPDCGLKTRTWEEVEPALENMVAAAKRARVALANLS